MANPITPAPLDTAITQQAGAIAGQSPWWIWFGTLYQYVSSFNSWSGYPASSPLTVSSTMALSGVAINHADFQQIGSTALLYLDVAFTLGGVPSNSVSLTLPTATAGWGGLNARLIDNGVMVAAVAFINAGKIEVQRADGSNFALGPCEVFISGSYRVS